MDIESFRLNLQKYLDAQNLPVMVSVGFDDPEDPGKVCISITKQFNDLPAYREKREARIDKAIDAVCESRGVFNFTYDFVQ
ncbi:MAG: hypothetical protein KDJ35_04740 [Alphaproteobacteria bacterium]|nr:hypothetical protein [Alphaproteobacteria bacterium]